MEHSGKNTTVSIEVVCAKTSVRSASNSSQHRQGTQADGDAAESEKADLAIAQAEDLLTCGATPKAR